MRRMSIKENLTMKKPHLSHWDSRLFIIAGGFMLLNTILLWVRYYSSNDLSILWAAIPAILSLATGVFGLCALYPRATKTRPLIAKCGAGFAVLAGTVLALAALWIFAVSVFGDGMPQPVPQWFLMLIATFMLSVVLAFFGNALAFLLSEERVIGYFLAVPVVMWGLMLMMSIFKGLEFGLSLDFYTNGFIAASFLSLGFTLNRSNTQSH